MEWVKENRSNVRITDEAHGLLTEKAEYLGATMKEVASEAIFLMFSKERAQKDCMGLIEEGKKECIAQRDGLKERVKGLQKIVRNSRRHADGMFILGAIVAGCLMFFVGVLW